MDLNLARFSFNRRLLTANKQKLSAALKPFLEFKDCELYYPDKALGKAELLAAEKLLLAPVRWHDREIAALRFQITQPQDARLLLPTLPAIITLCLENIALNLAARLDRHTGLLSEEAFLDEVAASVQFFTKPDAAATVGKTGGFGLIILEWIHADNVRKRAGYSVRSKLWRALAAKLVRMLPQNAEAGCLGGNQWLWEFAVLLPAPGRAACHALARKIINELAKVKIEDPFSSSAIPTLLYAGHCLYPQDLQGRDLARPAREKALILQDRARLAAKAAAGVQNSQPIMAFGWLLSRGGIVLGSLPHGRLRISLGRASYARPGMRFYVIAPGEKNRGSKAEIIIRKTGERDSEAEIFHMENQNNPPLPGDCLVLFPQSHTSSSSCLLLDHVSFFEQFAARSAHTSRFVLSISRFLQPQEGKAARESGKQLAAYAGNIARRQIAEPLSGWYGRNGVIIFWPETRAEKVLEVMRKAHAELQKVGSQPATGIFAYPFLNFSKGESEACALKSLEYAELLPAPHIGGLDDLALTISGDKRFSQGDELGAMDDYKLALLVNPDNALTLNSLAVCMAAMRRPEDARSLLQKALACHPDNTLKAKIAYNLANIYQKENDVEEARSYYRMCVKADPGHAYAWLRMGQLHAQGGRLRPARAIFHHVERLAQNQADIANIARRQLARLAAGENRKEDARDFLHDSLLLNPADTDSLLFLAKTYLDDDPATAETLARKCLRLGADAFDVLALALENQGRHEESRKVAKRA